MGEFGARVLRGSWWNSSQNLFGLSPCSLPINDTGNFEGWMSHDMLTKTIKDTTCTSYDSPGFVSDKSVVLQEFDQPNPSGNMPSIDSNLKMMESNYFLSTNTTIQHDWNQDLVVDNERLDENYSHLLKEATPINPSMNHRPQTCHNLYENSSSNSTISIPTSTASYNYNSVQNLLQHLFDIDSQPEKLLADTYSLSLINSNEFLSSLPKPSSVPKVKQQNHSQVANKTFWNSTAAMDTFPMSLRRQSESLPPSVNSTNPNNITLKRLNSEIEGDISMMQKSTNDGPTFKRPRTETPSPLPAFKVRKDKMGDRITALQQLVSPFGKTDTASVLYEAIEYIKFLHDQVNALSTPSLKSGSHPLQCQQATQKVRYEKEIHQDLKSRGLCLVPVSSTFPVAVENTTEFWSPTFGGSFN